MLTKNKPFGGTEILRGNLSSENRAGWVKISANRDSLMMETQRWKRHLDSRASLEFGRERKCRQWHGRALDAGGSGITLFSVGGANVVKYENRNPSPKNLAEGNRRHF